MKGMEVKSKVLKEIMDLMGEKDGYRLKSHPKFMAMKVSKVEPVGKEIVEEKPELESDDLDLESLDPDLLEKLMKLAK